MEADRKPGLAGAMALGSAVWLALGAAHVALSHLAPRGTLRDPLLPAGARLALAGMELVAQAAAVAALGALFGLLGRLPGRRAAGPARCALAAALLLGLAASWAAFWIGGRFLDREGAAFCAANFYAFYLFAAQMHPFLIHAGPLLLVAAAAAACLFLPRAVGRLPRAGKIGIIAAGGLLAVTAAAVAAWGGMAFRKEEQKITDPATGVVYTPREIYRLRREQAAGPLVHLGARLLAPGRRDDGLPRVAPPEVVRRPILTMEEYLAGTGPGRADRWNVVVILVESLRADQLRDYGCPRDVMPAVDALALESRVFLDCYAQASHTDFSIPCVFSSHYPLRMRDAWRYPASPTYPRVMIYDVLRALGYRTAAFSSQNERWGQMSNYLKTEGLEVFSFPGASGGLPPTITIDDRITVSDALSWIDGPGEGPFFLYLNLQGSHLPYDVPEDFPRRFGPREIDFVIGAGTFPPEKAETARNVYADSLSYVDTQVDRVLRHLRARGLWDRTVVLISGDHGEAFYEHGSAAHANGVYEEIVRVPLIVRAPGLEPGRDARPAQQIDVPPTICRLLGIPPHPSFQGMDLLGSGFPADRSRFLVLDTAWMTQSAIVRSGLKLIHDPQLGRCLLYDLEEDPGEKRDVSSSRPEAVRDLARRLAEWRRAQLDYYGNPLRHGLEYPPVLSRP